MSNMQLTPVESFMGYEIRILTARLEGLGFFRGFADDRMLIGCFNL
jgi:hypothetical protein